jgi:hypothetical protein
MPCGLCSGKAAVCASMIMTASATGVWPYLRGRFLAPRLWPTHVDILDARCAARNALLRNRPRGSLAEFRVWKDQAGTTVVRPWWPPPAGFSAAARIPRIAWTIEQGTVTRRRLTNR